MSCEAAIASEHDLAITTGGQAVGIVALGELTVERDLGSALGDISAVPPNT